MDNNLRIFKGPAASNTYLSMEGKDIAQLTLDWSFDAIYYKIRDEDWVTISIGELMEQDEIYKIDTSEKIKVFKKLAFYTLSELRNYSGKSDKALAGLLLVLDKFI